jgi:hypothetical protein
MDKLNEIIKNQMISSFETNVALRFQYKSLFRIYYVQNIKYHIMWLFFHSFSFAYPEFPSEEYKIETANFLANIIPKNLTGCGSCQNDYKIFIEKLNIYRVISSKQELSSFFVDLHNFINAKKFEQNSKVNINNNYDILINSKQQNTSPILCEYNDVKYKYEQTDYIFLLEEKYNINMFKLIESKNLSEFFNLLNNFNFQEDTNTFNITINIS